MKFARLAALPLPFVLCMSHGCSDPPAPPAQAALTFATNPSPGLQCTTTNPQLSIPASNSTGVLQELNCDLSAGCKPDDYVVVDRDRGANVSCIVAPQGDGYTVSLSLNYDGDAVMAPTISFSVTGTVSATGGMVNISQTNSQFGGGQDPACTVTIAPPKGVVGKGKIWGNFSCMNFRDTHNIGDTGCNMNGIFLFENCTGT
ncbi:MAG TPA: hypothetical protein VH062_15840 [Polyangiaceae bacterium]|jgi:hypothetical protein|nr:hypothetical protein [Polyangiaceae bacterium]